MIIHPIDIISKLLFICKFESTPPLPKSNGISIVQTLENTFENVIFDFWKNIHDTGHEVFDLIAFFFLTVVPINDVIDGILPH
jgi:hypothetical protein